MKWAIGAGVKNCPISARLLREVVLFIASRACSVATSKLPIIVISPFLGCLGFEYIVNSLYLIHETKQERLTVCIAAIFLGYNHSRGRLCYVFSVVKKITSRNRAQDLPVIASEALLSPKHGDRQRAIIEMSGYFPICSGASPPLR